jgi:hypothetical protein
MNTRPPILLFAMLAFVLSFSLPSAAADGASPDSAPGAMRHESAALQACPANTSQGVSLAQTFQTACCKGNKGICGCRAGKIVCCDGSTSTSPDCTCHADSGIDN